MFSEAFLSLIALFYYLCFLLLAGLTLFVAFRSSQRTRSRVRLHRAFFLLALSLLLWQVTLFLEVRVALPDLQLWLGRANFTAIVFVVYFALRFVQAVPLKGPHQAVRSSWLLCTETTLLAGITLLTPLVTVAERVGDGQAISTFGPLFPCYLLHVMGYLTATLIVALQERRNAKDRTTQRQLTLIVYGIFATGSIALITNALLPYRYGDFRFSDTGTLSTLLFTLCIAYATFLHRLFEARLLLRATLVYGTLLVFVLSVYSSMVMLITNYLTSGSSNAKQFVVLMLAFSFDPLRRLLEKKADDLLFGQKEAKEKERKRSRRSHE